MHGKDVFDDDDCIQEEEGCHSKYVSQDQVEVAGPCCIGTNQVSEDGWKLNQNVPKKTAG
jgi:hypothetical protein